MNEKTQARTLIKALRQKYNEADNDLNRKKILFVARTIQALLDEHNPPQGKLRSTT